MKQRGPPTKHLFSHHKTTFLQPRITWPRGWEKGKIYLEMVKHLMAGLMPPGNHDPQYGGAIGLIFYACRVFAVVSLVRFDQNSILWCWTLLAEKPVGAGPG
jgi:hypothetical protein